jgi:glucosamine-6-phosphate deaminase
VSLNVHRHTSILHFNEAISKQAAALIRISLVSTGQASVLLSSEPELEGILTLLSASEGIDWSKVTLFCLSDFLGVSRSSRLSMQNDLHRKLLAQNPAISTKALINGESVPSSEVTRLSFLINQQTIDLALLSPGETGALGLLESASSEISTIDGYSLCEPSDSIRKSFVQPNRFKSINEVPQRGITLSTKSILRAKNILCCLEGNKKSALLNLLDDGVITDAPIGALKKHPALHIHLGPSISVNPAAS